MIEKELFSKNDMMFFVQYVKGSTWVVVGC